MIRPLIGCLAVLGLAAGCSSSSSGSRDSRPTDDAAGQIPSKGDTAASSDAAPLRQDVAIQTSDAQPAKQDVPSVKDGPASSGDVFEASGDSSLSLDRPTPTLDGATEGPARDTADTRAGADAKDAPGVCTPGVDLSCNELPGTTAAGTCLTDGTCACKSGYAIVPSSGRCLALPSPAVDASSGDAELVCASPYLSCVCQCCPSAPRDAACYYPSAGETLQAIKDKEAADRNVVNCAGAGCSSGTRYVCCMPAAPEPASAATYSASAYSGDMDNLTIRKVGTPCAQILLSRPAKTRAGFHLDGASGWGLMAANFGVCPEGSYVQSVEGALGTVEFRGEGNNCEVDVHMTLYDLSATGEMKTIRMDIDGLSVTGLFSCR
jgi:hypothetical protein